MPKPKIAILLEFGFHDVKKFIHSGFYLKIAEEYEIIWISLDKSNKVFRNYFEQTGFKLEFLKSEDLTNYATKVDQINTIVRTSWLKNKNIGLFHNYKLIAKKSIKDRVLGSPLLKKFIEKRAIRNFVHFSSEQFKSVFTKHQIEGIACIGHSSLFFKNMAATAIKLEIPVFCLVNSWKDLFTNNFIFTDQLSRIYVWDVKMKKDYEMHMPYLLPENIKVTGNPTLDILHTRVNLNSRDYYAEKYNLDPASSWLYYTLMPPGLIENEIETVQFIAERFWEEFKSEKTIIIRKNPNHGKEDFKEMSFPPNVRLSEHYCEFDKEQDMIIQSKEGEMEWLDLLDYSAVNLSIPSTVTTEFRALGKPVLNIEFNQKNQIETSLIQFFESGFYRELFDDKTIFRVQNIDQLVQIVKQLDFHPSVLKEQKETASDLILKDMRDFYTNKNNKKT